MATGLVDLEFVWVGYCADWAMLLLVVVEDQVSDAEEESVSSELEDVLLGELPQREAEAEAEAVSSRSPGTLALN